MHGAWESGKFNKVYIKNTSTIDKLCDLYLVIGNETQSHDVPWDK